MKSISIVVALCLLAILVAGTETQGNKVFANVVSAPMISSSPGNSRAAVSWAKKCGESEGGEGDSVLKKDMEFSACFNFTCETLMNSASSSHQAVMYFKPSKTESNLSVEVLVTKEGRPIELPTIIEVPGPFNTTNEHQINVNLTFNAGTVWSYNGTYDMQFKLFNPEDERNVLCRSFPLKAVVLGNSGTAPNATCTWVGEPCDFFHSNCDNTTDQPTCQCDSLSFHEGPERGCKVRVGAGCRSDDCIHNAVCSYITPSIGICYCDKGYHTNATHNNICSPILTNNGSTVGASCTYPYQPCDFDNSMCVQDNGPLTCQCDTGHLDEGAGRGCKKIVGTVCGYHNECIRNAGCFEEPGEAFSYCKCTSGYQHNPANLSNCDPPNTGTYIGANCTNLFDPCSFQNSMCVKNESTGQSNCQCDSVSFDEDELYRGCKKIVGTYCENSTECISHAECKIGTGLNFGFCSCGQGYANDKNALNICLNTEENTGKKLGAPCYVSGAPCAFYNSMCAAGDPVGGGSKACECNSYSVTEAGGSDCKSMVGRNCTHSGECVSNAECQGNPNAGICKCVQGYSDKGDLTQCTLGGAGRAVGAGVLTVLAVLLAALQLQMY